MELESGKKRVELMENGTTQGEFLSHHVGLHQLCVDIGILRNSLDLENDLNEAPWKALDEDDV